MVLPVTVNGLSVNSDGLYRFNDLDARFEETIGEYDAIVDEATAVKTINQPSLEQPEPIYNLLGQRLSSTQRGVNIIGGKKQLVK